jgi:hypothetical protein
VVSDQSSVLFHPTTGITWPAVRLQRACRKERHAVRTGERRASGHTMLEAEVRISQPFASTGFSSRGGFMNIDAQRIACALVVAFGALTRLVHLLCFRIIRISVFDNASGIVVFRIHEACVETLILALNPLELGKLPTAGKVCLCIDLCTERLVRTGLVKVLAREAVTAAHSEESRCRLRADCSSFKYALIC